MTERRSKLWVAALALLLVASSAEADDEQALFNGKDLSGWRGNPDVWTVEDGVILGRTTKGNPVKHNTFLIYDKPFANFELTLKYKIIGGNSGVQYRSKVIDETKFIVGGYQADFEAGKNYSGILYEERGRGILANRGQKVVIDANGQRRAQQVADTSALQKQIRNEDWNDYRVVASGERLQHYINGHLTADVTDRQASKRAASGLIAFQVHAGPPMKVYFKDIVVRPTVGSAKRAGKNGEAPNLAADPAPMWIWAADGGDACQLQKQFPGGAKSAHLLATCDNSMVVYLNGKKVAASSDWEHPVSADVSKWLVAGDNQIRVDAGDAGGEMGFVMKLILTMPDGTRKYVVTDNTWQGAAKKDAKAAPVKVFGEMGVRPWGNVFATASVPASLAVPQTLTLSPMFRDSAVLQRDRDVPVWGWAEPGAEVTVEFAGQSVKTTTDNDGAWILNLKPLKVNKEPQKMTVMAGGKTVTLGDILVGDVWFCSGQSNMEWIVGQSLFPEFVDPEKLGVIRHFKFPHVTKGPTPIRSNGNVGPWQVCNSTTVGRFTAVGFYFAYTLNKELDIPVGLIGCNWGGCRIEPWIPPAGLELVKEQNPEKWPQKSVMFHGMATVAIPYAIKGSLWYQGESNGGEGEEYFWKTKALHEGWQKVWGQGEFPFYFAQLASFQRPNPDPAGGDGWARVREAQRLCLTLPNTGMAVLTDIGEASDIHPRNKYDVGRRLALWALAKDYGRKDLVYSGPLFKSAEFKGGNAIISFDHCKGLKAAKKDGPRDMNDPKPVQGLTGFAIAGEDKKWVWADARIEGDEVVLSAEEVPNPVAARYLFTTNTDHGTLYNGANLPAAPFRTDAW